MSAFGATGWLFHSRTEIGPSHFFPDRLAVSQPDRDWTESWSLSRAERGTSGPFLRLSLIEHYARRPVPGEALKYYTLDQLISG